MVVLWDESSTSCKIAFRSSSEIGAISMVDVTGSSSEYPVETWTLLLFSADELFGYPLTSLWHRITFLFSGRVCTFSGPLSISPQLIPHTQWTFCTSRSFSPSVSLSQCRNMDGNCWESFTSCRESSWWGSRPTPATRSYHITVSPTSRETDFLMWVYRQ